MIMYIKKFGMGPIQSNALYCVYSLIYLIKSNNGDKEEVENNKDFPSEFILAISSVILACYNLYKQNKTERIKFKDYCSFTVEQDYQIVRIVSEVIWLDLQSEPVKSQEDYISFFSQISKLLEITWDSKLNLDNEILLSVLLFLEKKVYDSLLSKDFSYDLGFYIKCH